MGRFSAALWAVGLTLGVALMLSAFDQKTEAQRANPPTTGNPPSSIPMGGNKSVTRFFVTSKGIGKGGDLGGLAGADAHCQALAKEQGAGDHTWRAYLSTEATATTLAVNARDRIGAAPGTTPAAIWWRSIWPRSTARRASLVRTRPSPRLPTS